MNSRFNSKSPSHSSSSSVSPVVDSVTSSRLRGLQFPPPSTTVVATTDDQSTSTLPIASSSHLDVSDLGRSSHRSLFTEASIDKLQASQSVDSAWTRPSSSRSTGKSKSVTEGSHDHIDYHPTAGYDWAGKALSHQTIEIATGDASSSSAVSLGLAPHSDINHALGDDPSLQQLLMLTDQFIDWGHNDLEEEFLEVVPDINSTGEADEASNVGSRVAVSARSRASTPDENSAQFQALSNREILQWVFTEYCIWSTKDWPRVPHTSRSGPFVLAQVNRRWRSSAVSLPQLWTAIVVYHDYPIPSVETIAVWLERSRALPLYITFNVGPASIHETQVAKLPSARLRAIYRLLAQHTDRWEYVDLSLGCRRIEPFTNAVQDLMRAHKMRTLVLDILPPVIPSYRTAEESALEQALHPLPAPSWLHWRNIDIGVCASVVHWSQLVVVKLNATLDISDCLAILAQCTRARVIHLYGIISAIGGVAGRAMPPSATQQPNRRLAFGANLEEFSITNMRNTPDIMELLERIPPKPNNFKRLYITLHDMPSRYWGDVGVSTRLATFIETRFAPEMLEMVDVSFFLHFDKDHLYNRGAVNVATTIATVQKMGVKLEEVLTLRIFEHPENAKHDTWPFHRSTVPMEPSSSTARPSVPRRTKFYRRVSDGADNPPPPSVKYYLVYDSKQDVP